MTDDNPFIDRPIPAFIKSMLAPFVNVVGPHERPRERTVIETTYLSDIHRPEPEILQAIGRVATVWAVMERILGMMLTRLTMAPDYPTMALTKDLSLDNQLKAMKTLLALHRERYAREIMARSLVEALSLIPAKIWALKDERNVVVHTVWTRMGKGGVTPLATRPVSMSQAAKAKVDVKTAPEINNLADRIQAQADELYLLVQMLPSVDEAQHVKLLSQEVDRLHNEILPERPAPPAPSQA